MYMDGHIWTCCHINDFNHEYDNSTTKHKKQKEWNQIRMLNNSECLQFTSPNPLKIWPLDCQISMISQKSTKIFFHH